MEPNETGLLKKCSYRMIAEAEFFFAEGDSIYCILSRASIRLILICFSSTAVFTFFFFLMHCYSLMILFYITS